MLNKFICYSSVKVLGMSFANIVCFFDALLTYGGKFCVSLKYRARKRSFENARSAEFGPRFQKNGNLDQGKPYFLKKSLLYYRAY